MLYDPMRMWNGKQKANENKLIETEDRSVVTSGGGEGGRAKRVKGHICSVSDGN